MNYRPFIRYKKFWWALGLIGLALLLTVCLLPPRELPESTIPYLDKIVHFTAYFWASVYFNALITKRVNVFLFLSLYGLFIEILQFFSPLRSFEIADMIANSSGALLGPILFPKVVIFIIEKIEGNLLS